MNTKRKRDAVKDLGTKFLNANLEKINKGRILHWDGKIFKKLTHVGKSQERVAILIEQNGEDILLGIPTVELKVMQKLYIREHKHDKQV